MRMNSGTIDLKRRNRIASIIEAKPGELWPISMSETTPYLKPNSAKNSSHSLNSRQTNLTLVDFNVETYKSSLHLTLKEGTRLSIMRPHTSLPEGKVNSEQTNYDPQEQSLTDDYDGITSLYSENVHQPPPLPSNMIFSLVKLCSSQDEYHSLPLTWSTLCMKTTALFNEINLASCHNHKLRYFGLTQELIVLSSRLLTVIPHSSPDGRMLLTRASEITNVLSRLLIELFEASGSWPSTKDSLGDLQHREVSTSSCLIVIRDYLQAAQYHSRIYNSSIDTAQPYLPLVLESKKLVLLTDFKYSLRLDFLVDRIAQTGRNVILAISTCAPCTADRPCSIPSNEYTIPDRKEAYASSISDLLDAVQFYVSSVGHFLSLIGWVLAVPLENPSTSTHVILLQVQDTMHRLLEWAKTCLHVLTPTAVQLITLFGLERICLDLAPWFEGALLSQDCMEKMRILINDASHKEELTMHFPSPMQLAQARNYMGVDLSSYSTNALRKVASEACLIAKLQKDMEITLSRMRGPTADAKLTAISPVPSKPGHKSQPSISERSSNGAVFYHADGSGRVKLGTWQGLVEQLVPKERTVCSGFLRVFFLTFRTFATPHQLFYALTEHFEEIPSPRLLPVNVRISNALISWLELYFFEEDVYVAPMIREFTINKIIPSMPAVGSRIVEATSRVLESQFLDIKMMSSPLSRSTIKYQCLSISDPETKPPSHRSSNSRGSPSSSTSSLLTFSRMHSLRQGNYFKLDRSTNPLLEWGPAVLASTLILIDAELFGRVRPQHIISYVTAKSSSKNRTSFTIPSPTPDQTECPVKRLVDWSNQVNHWVVETILWENDIKQRAAILKAFINVVEKLIFLNNFNMAMSILSGLNTSAITRLQSTWYYLPIKTRELMNQHNMLFDPHRNFSAYRMRLKSIPSATPCIPFFGITLTDITFLLQGNPTYRTLASITSSLPSREPELPALRNKRVSHLRHQSEFTPLPPGSRRSSLARQSTRRTSIQTIKAPWEAIPDPTFINFDKFHRLVQVLDGLEDRQASPYMFPHLDHPQVAMHSLREHIFGLPSASQSGGGGFTFPSSPGPMDSLSSSDYHHAHHGSFSYNEILIASYEDSSSPSEPTSPYSSISTHSNSSCSAPVYHPAPSFTYTLTPEDYFQKSLLLEPRKPPPSPSNVSTH